MTAGLAAAREHWPRARLEADRDRRLRALVRHAYGRVPFYRALYDRHGVDVEAFRGRADLEKLPVIGKADIQAGAADQWRAQGYLRGPLQVKRTSGSSGQPLEISVTRLEQVVLRNPKCQTTRAALEQLLHQQLGAEVDCELRVVDRIESGPGGKLRLIHSQVASHYEG